MAIGRKETIMEKEQEIRVKLLRALEEELISKLEEERELSYADFSKYVNDYNLNLDDEYDDFYHKGLARATELIKQIVGEKVS